MVHSVHIRHGQDVANHVVVEYNIVPETAITHYLCTVEVSAEGLQESVKLVIHKAVHVTANGACGNILTMENAVDPAVEGSKHKFDHVTLHHLHMEEKIVLVIQEERKLVTHMDAQSMEDLPSGLHLVNVPNIAVGADNPVPDPARTPHLSMVVVTALEPVKKKEIVTNTVANQPVKMLTGTTALIRKDGRHVEMIRHTSIRSIDHLTLRTMESIC